jgi:hypothetical protein
MPPATWSPGRKAARLLPGAVGKRCKRAGSEGAEKTAAKLGWHEVGDAIDFKRGQANTADIDAAMIAAGFNRVAGTSVTTRCRLEH